MPPGRRAARFYWRAVSQVSWLAVFQSSLLLPALICALTIAISGRSLRLAARRERRMYCRALDAPRMPCHGPPHRVVMPHAQRHGADGMRLCVRSTFDDLRLCMPAAA